MRRIEDMYMSFAGVRNDEVGALLASMPIRQHTALRGDKAVIPGRDGFVFTSTGHSEVVVKQDIVVADEDRLQKVLSWLHGSGELRFGDDPDYVYDAMVLTVNALQSPMRRLTGQKFTVTFTCQPFRRLVKEKALTLTTSATFQGNGDVNSLPLVRVEAATAGAHALTINDRAMELSVDFDDPLYIDCDAGLVYTIGSDGGFVFAGEKISQFDDWFELNTGANAVTLSSGLARVVIQPRWRFI